MNPFEESITKQTLLVPTRVSKKLSAEEVMGTRAIINQQYAAACMAGAYLALGALNQSHEISQNLTISAGSYWHAIMHRMEGDYSNSCYWLRQASLSTPFSKLPAELQTNISDPAHDLIREIVESQRWQPTWFVTAVEALTTANENVHRQLQIIQSAEWTALYHYCYEQALQ